MLVIRLRPRSGVAELALLSGSPRLESALPSSHPCPYDVKEGYNLYRTC